jgi:arylsulfatase A-like enzyme
MSKPNIITILLDDATQLDVTIMLSAFFPNIKAKIGDPGVKLANAFATSSLCSPSRASILSGKYPHNHGVLSNEAPNGGFVKFLDGDTLATRLQVEGYHTGLIGKYLNNYGTGPNSPTYIPPGWDDWKALINATYSVFDYSMNHNGSMVNYGHAPADYQTAVLGDLAAASVTAGLATGKPLFLHVAPMAPHVEDWTIGPTLVDGFQENEDPWRWVARPDPRDQTGPKAAWWSYIANILTNYVRTLPSWNEADVSDKPAFMQNQAMDAADIGWSEVQYRTRLLCLLPVDDIVGKIAAALGPTQLANTVFILASDNGFMLGEHRKSQKLAAYEPSIRVPLYISGPGIVPHTEQGMALLQDLYPTILEIAGAPANIGVDGRSLMPILTSTTGGWARKRFLVSHTQVTTGVAPDLPTFSAVRTGPLDSYPQRTYVEYIGGELEHYSLATDPHELTNTVTTAPGAEIAALHGYLTTLKTCAGTTVAAAEN